MPFVTPAVTYAPQLVLLAEIGSTVGRLTVAVATSAHSDPVGAVIRILIVVVPGTPIADVRVQVTVPGTVVASHDQSPGIVVMGGTTALPAGNVSVSETFGTLHGPRFVSVMVLSRSVESPTGDIV
ncbi:MAG TPA: hypothetical protein VGS01_03220 [Candidatus Limnocylindria bacterium]|nr:hypothetical protein [Candidatus Limnocylindria bacterium]